MSGLMSTLTSDLNLHGNILSKPCIEITKLQQQRKQSHSFHKMVSDVVVHVSLCCNHVHCIYCNVVMESVMTLSDQ